MKVKNCEKLYTQLRIIRKTREKHMEKKVNSGNAHK